MKSTKNKSKCAEPNWAKLCVNEPKVINYETQALNDVSRTLFIYFFLNSPLPDKKLNFSVGLMRDIFYITE